jgi:hypothetical protein
VKQYIDTNKKRPSENDKNNDIKQLGYWLSHQQKNYKKKNKNMSNNTIYNEWKQFTESDKYKEYFMSYEELWYDMFNKVKQYIDSNGKRPSTHDKNSDIKSLGKWISHQQTNYKNKQYIMSNSTIYNEWTKFINSNKYKKYFIQENDDNEI